jgi:hypothetical protein
MSEALTVQGNNALQLGGIGMGAGIFKARPMLIELVHKTSRQENVIYGQFRVVSTNEHLGTSLRVVLLAVPQEQREWFEGAEFKKENKQCFSLDCIQPHPRAANPPAMYCRTCPKGDLNWDKWRKTKDAKDLPPCGAYWHLLLADRLTQTPYFLNVKGKSATPFRQAMEQQMSGMLAKIFANVKAQNKLRGYVYATAQNTFVPVPGFVVPEDQKKQLKEGETQLPPLPSPNIFDISFEIKSSSRDGGPYVMSFGDFKLMGPEDKAEFGQLYLDIVASRVQVEPTEEELAAQEVSEATAPTSAEVKGEVLPPQQPPITI